MLAIEAPQHYPEKVDLFLAGGISNCPDWQREALQMLADEEGTALNPRRSVPFEEHMSNEQIRWEYEALRAAGTVMFWFPKDTLCPIALFELGVFSQKPEIRLIVGTDPEYARRLDIIVQMELARPEVAVHSSLQGLILDYKNQHEHPSQ